jgi:hypothetical protein
VVGSHGIIAWRRFRLDDPAAARGRSFSRARRSHSGAALPGKPFPRRIAIASQKGEGRHIAPQIHNAALDALRTHFVAKLRATLPHIADRIILHATGAKPARNRD